MDFLLSLALGAVVFSLLVSLCLFARHSRRDPTDYEKWVDEMRSQNIVNSRRTFSKV